MSINREAIKIDQDVWRVSIPYLKGKTTRRRNDPVGLNPEAITSIPPDIIKNHGTVIMAMDIMHVNGVAFLTTSSRVINFTSATEVINADMKNVVIALGIILCKYKSRGFNVLSIAADNGFAVLEQNEEFIKLGVVLNLTAEDEHEPHIERFNRTLKERCRMIYAGIPFLRMPRRIVVDLVYQQVYWFNFTIPENYISTILGPAAIVLGRTYDYNMICGPGTKYGEYVQTHEKTNNTMQARTVSAICLRPTGNTQGSFYYYSLLTGRRLHRRRRTSLPMPEEVIARVHHISERQKFPKGLAFARYDGTPYDDDDEDLAEDEATIDDDGENARVQFENTNDNSLAENAENTGVANEDNEDDDFENAVEAIPIQEQEPDIMQTEDQTIIPEIVPEIIPRATTEEISQDAAADAAPPDVQDINAETREVYLGRTRSGRPVRKPRLQSVLEGHQFSTVDEKDTDTVTSKYSIATDEIVTSEKTLKTRSVDESLCAQTTYINSLNTHSEINSAVQHAIEHLILTQVGMKKGVKLWGKRGVDAIFKE